MSQTPEAQEPQEPQEPQPPVLKRDGFQFSKEGFGIDDNYRIYGPRLLGLSTEIAHHLFSEQVLASHLRHYGIPLESTNKEQLKLLLQDAVNRGKCNHVPVSLRELEASMRADYGLLQQKWEADCTAWRAEKKRRDDKAFAHCKTPDERAKVDVHRFMDMYFLTKGIPDKTKTTEVLTLSLKGSSAGELLIMTQKVSGLHMYYPTDMPIGKIRIGWNQRLVFKRFPEEITAKNAEKEELWEEQLERHRKYVTQVQSEETSNEVGKDPQAFNLDRCLGSYVIRCDNIKDSQLHGKIRPIFTMNISSGGGNTLRAAYNSGMIQGTMILSGFPDTPRATVDPDSLGCVASSNEDDIGLPDDNAERCKTPPGPPPPRRLYSRFHENKALNGVEIHHDELWHLDFQSDECVSFTGLVDALPYVGENVKLEGYKVVG